MARVKPDQLLDATERVRGRLGFEANQYVAMAEPLVVLQYVFFRSLIQEAHLYALIDQLSTGKMDTMELQKRFVDHGNRIATELSEKRGVSKVVTPGKA